MSPEKEKFRHKTTKEQFTEWKEWYPGKEGQGLERKGVKTAKILMVTEDAGCLLGREKKFKHFPLMKSTGM